MNSVNQNRQNVKSFNRYKVEGKDEPYKLLIRKYTADVQKKIVDILQGDKGLPQEDANDFMTNMFSLGFKREKDIRSEISKYYDEGKTVKQCANQLINKYYNITKINKYHNKKSFQTNRELSGEGEVVEVVEGIKYEKFKKVSISLFWNFINRINELGLKFIFDTSYIKNIENSLNTDGYVLFMETPKINNKEVEYEFKYSKILSNILSYIIKDKTDNNISFYTGFDGKSQLHFGFIINNKRYKIGYVNYKSYDFYKLIPYIKANRDINLEELSRKFVTNIDSLNSIKTILKLYLDKYEDDIEIYSTIINNKFGLIIETLDDDIITQPYIEEIIRKYVKISHYSNWYVEKMKSNNKTVYYFILK